MFFRAAFFAGCNPADHLLDLDILGTLIFSAADFQLCNVGYYPGRKIWLLLDEASGHTAFRSQELAAELDIILLWLPKQCSELNAMDQLWKELKNDLAANRQFKSIDEAVDYAEQ